ncbi:MAG: hypothetical protein QG588_1343, partial [Candidatus Poribacteria bacterium]|nr:hypothetical protein [Candidatus Poribacteria bacterium]
KMKNKHGDTEKKDEGGRMMDEKEETSITVSAPLSRGISFILHHSSFILSSSLRASVSPCLTS